MSGTGVLSPTFSIFVDNTSANQLTIAPLGVQYEIIGVRVQDTAGNRAVEVRQTDNAGLQIAAMTTPGGAGTSFISLNTTRNNRIIPATTPIWIEPTDTSIILIEIICIGIQGITPPGLETGVSPLTIATGP